MNEKIKNFVFIILGTFFLILGVIGAVIPVLPTTPFIMLTCFFYVNSSEKLHNKMINSTFYNKYAKDFIDNRSMTLRQKIMIITFAYTMLLFPLIILDGFLKLFIVLMYLFIAYYFRFKITTI